MKNLFMPFKHNTIRIQVGGVSESHDLCVSVCTGWNIHSLYFQRHKLR